MSNQRFRLDFEFENGGPGDVEKIIEVEWMLRRDLRIGEVQGHQVGLGQAILSITTEEPAECFDQALRQLESVELIPCATRFAAISPLIAPVAMRN